MLLLLNADQKVVWFNVSVQETILVHKLNSLQHLYGQHQNRFQGKFPAAVFEQILQTWSEEINDHNIIVTFHSKKVHLG
jgi:hypothetical protein